MRIVAGASFVVVVSLAPSGCAPCRMFKNNCQRDKVRSSRPKRHFPQIRAKVAQPNLIQQSRCELRVVLRSSCGVEAISPQSGDELARRRYVANRIDALACK
jgi:hypothetical protein